MSESDLATPVAEIESKTDNLTEQEFLAFRLGTEEYGIHILQTQEIRNFESLTRIANAPDYLKGVMNLRGVIVPVIDMRLRFNTGTSNADDTTVVIVLNIKGRVIGMMVDSVSDVVTIPSSSIKPPPELGSTFSTDYIIGLGDIDERMIILLDISKLMSGPELGLISED
ncbi:chemotaxis protein CheW [Undibacterium jejuense]|uniref:Chemotaxis protein CheW n=1 Tax=Undibacterium jejuense TaxID=1344949 RepID=A0A923KNU4_9BURK|nr:chemotaxis protein CheW [Undibacterium jejuense]MBC3860966.1 chemotaxis protein CheW [Undibacterium jejuense]